MTSRQSSCLEQDARQALGRASRLFLLLLLSVFIPSLAAEAQEPKAISVREAAQVWGTNLVPVHMGETVKLVGVLTSDPILVGSTVCLANLQDETGGIVLFTSNTGSLYGRFHRGDRLEVRGKISQFKGQEQLTVEGVRHLGTPGVPPPRDVLAADLLSERYQGRLVRVVGQLIVPRDALDRSRMPMLRDRSGEIPVLVYARLFNNPRFSERLMAGGHVEVVGVVGQFKEEPPYDSGYRLVPRGSDDFHFAPIPPYRAMAFSAALVLFLGLTSYLWFRRRSAERRAQEMAILTENLKRSEEALRLSAKQYRTLVEHAPEAVVVCDVDSGRFVDSNENAVRLYGLSREELLQQGPVALSPPLQPDGRPSEIAAWEKIKQALDGSTPVFEWVHRNAAGRDIPCEVRLVRLPSADRRLVRGSVTDITARKVIEEQLRQAQKMEAVGRLAGGVAHDFNNLLMVIKGHAELLRECAAAGDRCHRSVEQIQEAAERAASLTQQLLAYSRKQVIEPKVLDLNAVVAEMGKMIHRLIREDIELVVVPDAALGQVKADPGQIGQVLLNLAVNARDAMPEGGQLTIETANVYLDANYPRQQTGVKPGPYVMLAVSDTGAGMDAETVSHIFEPFFTTKEKHKGTGLGLATVFGIVKQSGGHIWVYSEPGKGATFKVYLPRIEAEVEEGDLEKALPASLQGSETVLLVEDEDAVRELVRDSLRSNGYTVLEARDGAEAFEFSQKCSGPIHLLVTDVVMPGMSGRELAHRLAHRRPKMKVLYISGYTEDAIIHHGVLDPGTVFLQKPFRPVDLGRKARELLDGSRREKPEPTAASPTI